MIGFALGDDLVLGAARQPRTCSIGSGARTSASPPRSITHGTSSSGHARRRSRHGMDAARSEALIAARTEEQRATRDRMVASRDALVAAEREKSERALAGEGGSRRRSSPRRRASPPRVLRSRHGSPRPRVRRSAPATGAAARRASSSGQLGWPVAGPVTSGYGSRWGRMHEGIDIAVGSRHPGPRGRGRNRHLRRLDGRIREPRRDRSRQRPVDGVRAQLEPDRRAGSRWSGRAS